MLDVWQVAAPLPCSPRKKTKRWWWWHVIWQIESIHEIKFITDFNNEISVTSENWCVVAAPCVSAELKTAENVEQYTTLIHSFDEIQSNQCTAEVRIFWQNPKKNRKRLTYTLVPRITFNVCVFVQFNLMPLSSSFAFRFRFGIGTQIELELNIEWWWSDFNAFASKITPLLRYWGCLDCYKLNIHNIYHIWHCLWRMFSISNSSVLVWIYGIWIGGGGGRWSIQIKPCVETAIEIKTFILTLLSWRIWVSSRHNKICFISI